MAFQATCDFCAKPIENVKDIINLMDEIQVPNVATIACKKCNKKITRRIHFLAVHYNHELMNDMRNWVSENVS